MPAQNKKAHILFVVLFVTLFGVISLFSADAFGENTVKIFVNGEELKSDVPAEIKNNTAVGSVRVIAQALGADVYWNKYNNSIEITNKNYINKAQVSNWISSQGKMGDYYLDGLSYQTVNLDSDEDPEVIAQIDGGVHLGNFFVFDKTQTGDYQLVEEKCWKVEPQKLNRPIYVKGIKMFETIERTGGTGVDMQIVHLWYLENGKMVEAFSGVIRDRETIYPNGGFSLTVGSYRIDGDCSPYGEGLNEDPIYLYYWQTTYRYADDKTAAGEPVTNLKTYAFDGKTFK